MSESNDVQMASTTTTRASKFIISSVANKYEHHLPDIRAFLVRYVASNWGVAEPTPTTKHLLWKWKRQGGSNIPPHIFCLLLDAYCYRLDNKSPSRFDLRRGISKEPSDHDPQPLLGIRSKITERDIKKSAAFVLKSSEDKREKRHTRSGAESFPICTNCKRTIYEFKTREEWQSHFDQSRGVLPPCVFVKSPTCVCTTTSDLLSPPHHHKCPVAILFEWVRSRKFAEPIERQSPLKDEFKYLESRGIPPSTTPVSTPPKKQFGIKTKSTPKSVRFNMDANQVQVLSDHMETEDETKVETGLIRLHALTQAGSEALVKKRKMDNGIDLTKEAEPQTVAKKPKLSSSDDSDFDFIRTALEAEIKRHEEVKAICDQKAIELSQECSDIKKKVDDLQAKHDAMTAVALGFKEAHTKAQAEYEQLMIRAKELKAEQDERMRHRREMHDESDVINAEALQLGTRFKDKTAARDVHLKAGEEAAEKAREMRVKVDRILSELKQ